MFKKIILLCKSNSYIHHGMEIHILVHHNKLTKSCILHEYQLLSWLGLL